MLTDLDHLARVSNQYEIKPEEILLIAINASGLANHHPSRRMRFRFTPFGHKDDPVYLIPSFGRRNSPFFIKNESLYFQNTPVGQVEYLQDDDIVLGYFRNGHSNLTLNTNARSSCTGCMFCYTRLDPASDPRIRVVDELTAYFEFLKENRNWDDFSPIDKISVCSGCFNNETFAIKHMEMVKKVATKYGFSGELHILTSVIRSIEGLDYIANQLSPFHLTLTIECFNNRLEILKRTKADLNFKKMVALLAYAKNVGIKTDFTYIVGLDPIEESIEYIAELKEHITTFPRFQIYQAHNSFQDSYRTPGSDCIEFFLTFRKQLEDLFRATSIRPKSWENYRPLWYYSFDGMPAVSQRI